MSVFTNEELDYLQQQKLGRLATVDRDGNPHVVPVGYRYNPEVDTIDIGGHNLGQSKKWQDIGRHPRVAIVIDDVLPPWKPRSIEILADVESLNSGGEKWGPGFAAQLLRLSPVRVISWGLNAAGHSSRKVSAKGYVSSESHVIV